MTDISAARQAEIPFIPLSEISCDMSAMTEPAEILRERLGEAIAKSSLSPRALSLAIGANHSYVSQILDGRGGMPAATRVLKLAEALDVSADWLLGEIDSPAPVRSEVSLSDKHIEWRGPDRAEPGIPLVGTGDCADLEVCTESGAMITVERSSFDPDHHVRMLQRPPALRGQADLYAIYFHGQSMEPRFEAGEVGIVDPRRPVRNGDYVLVQINGGDSDEVVSVLAKRLVRQNAAEVVLEQFNPPAIFTVPKNRVARVHRIMQQTELLFG
jgi:phage repressor protein C with HTH and peptisase S24 domain